MADFDENDINMVATNLGVPHDFVRSQLAAEGHRVLGSAAEENRKLLSEANTWHWGNSEPAPTPLPAAAAAGDGSFGGMGAAPEGWMDAPNAGTGAAPPDAPFAGWQPPSAPQAAPTAPQGPAQPWMVNAGNLAGGPDNVAAPVMAFAPKSSGAPQAPASPRAPIRATGAGLQQPGAAQPAPGGGAGGGGGMSRVRKMFDKREAGLEGEVQGAAAQVAQGQQRLGELQDQAFGFEQQRLGNEADASRKRADLYAGYEQQMADAQQQEAVARQKEQTVLAAKEQQHTQLVDDYAHTRIRDRPTSQRMASAFGLAFSGIADSINQAVGNRSQFLDGTMRIVDQAIDRDVQEQLEAIQQKKGAADDSERSLARLRTGIGDDRAFRAASRAAAYEQMAARANTIAQQSTSETAKIAAQAAGPEFQLRAQAARQEAAQLAMADAQKRLRESGDDRLGFEAKSALLAQSKAGSGAAKPEKVTPGASGLSRINPEATDADRAKSQEIASGSAGIMSNIDALTEMAKKGATLSIDQRQIAQRRLGALKSQFNGVFGDGTAPNEAQLEALDDMFSNPTEVNIGNAERQFSAFKQDALNQTNAKMRPYGHQLGADDFEPE